MQNDFSQFASQATSANKSFLEAAGKLNETSARTFDQLAKVQHELGNLMFEGNAKQLQLWSSGKDHSEILSAQSKLTDEYGKRYMQYAQQTLNILTGAGKAYSGLVEQGFGNATENFKRTASRRAA